MSAATLDDMTAVAELDASPREQALADVDRFVEAATRAEAARDTAAVELQSVEDGAGGSVLDSEEPGAAEELAATMGRLQATASIQSKVAAEAQRRAEQARTALLEAEADELEPEAARVRADLEAHRAKVATALARLVKLSGLDWRAVTLDVLIDERRGAGDFGAVSLDLTPEELLERQLETIEKRQALTRLVARDRDAGRLQMMGLDWDALPQAVREGEVPLEGFTVPEPRDWAREVGQARESLAAALSADLSTPVSSGTHGNMLEIARRNLRALVSQARAAGVELDDEEAGVP